VKVFAFSLLKPISNGGGHAGMHTAGPGQPANTASFKPFGDAYRGGVSLGTGWLAGSLGGAERIVVSQLADAGTVKVFSSGSALDDGPALYLRSPSEHGHAPTFREIASFNPFDGTSGTRVATTSTTTGADLLVSGVASQGQGSRRGEVRVRQAARSGDDAANRAPRRSFFPQRVRSRPSLAAISLKSNADQVRLNPSFTSHAWDPCGQVVKSTAPEKREIVLPAIVGGATGFALRVAVRASLAT